MFNLFLEKAELSGFLTRRSKNSTQKILSFKIEFGVGRIDMRATANFLVTFQLYYSRLVVPYRSISLIRLPVLVVLRCTRRL